MPCSWTLLVLLPALLSTASGLQRDTQRRRLAVMCGGGVRPGQVVRAVAWAEGAAKLRAAVVRDGVEVASHAANPPTRPLHTLLFRIPLNAVAGNYHLRVEGHWDDGSEFHNQTELTFSEKFLTILIQTNQLVYNLHQPMYIRIILLTTEQKPYTEPIDVHLVDPRGIIMKRWISVYPLIGMVNLEIDIPYDYTLGWWEVQVHALGQRESKRVLLERWFTHRFDINVATPPLLDTAEPFLEGQVLANYTSVATAAGSLTLQALARSNPNAKPVVLMEEKVTLFSGVHDFAFDVSTLRRAASDLGVRLDQAIVEVQAEVRERFHDFVVRGFARTLFVNTTLAIGFLGPPPHVFRPGMPFEAHVGVWSGDLQLPLDASQLAEAKLRVRARAGRKELPQQSISFNGQSVLQVRIDTPPKVRTLHVQVWYEDGVSNAKAELVAEAYESRHDRFLQITSPSERAQVGEFAVFHVRSNFYIDAFHYLVVSKGMILQSGSEQPLGMVDSITTFSIPVSAEMAPVFHVLVFHVAMDGELLTDGIVLPTDAINRHKFLVDINMNQERSGNQIEFIPRLTSESIIGLWGFDSDHISTHGRQQFSLTSITESLLELEKSQFQLRRKLWRQLDGAPERVAYFRTPSAARHTAHSFQFSNLVIVTNLFVNSGSSWCEIEAPCSRCSVDGLSHCERCQIECRDVQREQNQELFDFLLHRRNRQNAFYDATAGNFAWKNKIIGEDQEEYVPSISPKGPSAYAINAVGMNRKYGLHILPEYNIFDSTKPFFIIVEGPEEASLGEQIGLRVSVINFQFIEIKVEISVAASDSFRVVQVESQGMVSSHRPRTIAGAELQHLLYVKPVYHAFVYIPIVASVIGEIEVTIVGITQVAEDIATHAINIFSDGVPVHFHTSLLLDMKNEAYIIRYLHLNVTEDPIIPFEETYRLYIAGSPKASMSMIGDVVGAPFPVIPKAPTGIRALGMAEAVKSGEHIMFDFAYTLYSLTYLRLTNQLPRETLRGMLDYLNRALIYQTVYFKNGAFTMFKGHEPSLGLTAFCARVFRMAQHPDWEEQLLIDPNLLEQSVRFLLRSQAPDGSFTETTDKPWNRKLYPLHFNAVEERIAHLNITLTAQVLITLTVVSDLAGDIRSGISTAKNLAVQYLERRLPKLKDPYQVAIVTYALLEAGSVEAEVGFSKLDQIKRENEGLVYWSHEPVVSAEILYQNQRPFLLPRLPGKHDALAVEATAYALLVYVRYNALDQDRIVKWLSTMRTTDEAFVSSQDTLVAVQALTEYSFRTHVRDVTAMSVKVAWSCRPGDPPAPLAVASTNLSLAQHLPPLQGRVWGHVEVTARGAGLSLLQLHVSYHVDKPFLLVPPPQDAFQLDLKPHFHGRNKSSMDIRACARWTLQEESPESGVAVMEISLPTGYLLHKPELDAYVRSGVAGSKLQRGRVLPRSAVFLFHYLDSSWSCVDFTVHRWYPVANMTRFLKAKVFEYYTPERYKEIVYEDYDLYVLNICEVCGSYQCPYCPYFSSSNTVTILGLQLLKALLLGNILQKIMNV